MCSQYALRIPVIDDVCLLWYGVTYDSDLSYIIQACVIDLWCRLCCLWWVYIQWLMLLNTWYLICVSYIPLIATVWYIYHRPMKHVNDWYCILRIVIVSPHDAYEKAAVSRNGWVWWMICEVRIDRWSGSVLMEYHDARCDQWADRSNISRLI